MTGLTRALPKSMNYVASRSLKRGSPDPYIPLLRSPLLKPNNTATASMNDATKPRATGKEKCCAIYPRNAGPTRRPEYPMVVMAAMPAVEGIPGILPASLKNIGTILAAPTPIRMNPNRTRGSQAAKIITTSPEAAIRLPPATMILSLNLSTILSPDKRMMAIATEKAAYPTPENSEETDFISRRNTAP